MCKDCFSKTYKCEKCGEMSTEPMDEYESGHVCKKCAKKLFKCGHCGRHTQDPQKIDGKVYCSKCRDLLYRKCNRCSARIDRNKEYTLLADNTCLCPDCLEFYETENSKPKDFLTHLEVIEQHNDSSFGTDRYFGLEIETDSKSGKYASNFSRVSDGSIKGWEYLTPKLSGDKGMENLSDFCEQLRKNKNSADSGCGMHMHIDARDVSPDKLRNIMYFYKYMEDYLYSMIHSSRKGNHYCVPIIHSYDSIEACDTVEKLQDLYYSFQNGHNKSSKIKTLKSKDSNTRYRGVNASSYFFRGTLELRHHHGCVDFNTMYEWVVLNLNLFEFAVNNEFEKIKSLKCKNIQEAHDLAMIILGEKGIDLEKQLAARVEKYSGYKIKKKEKVTA
jgi:hypothetical protein